MANPQPDIFVRISKELARALYRTRIPGVERQVFDLILFETYGHFPTRKLVPIRNSEIAERVHIKRPNVVRAIKCLLDRNILIRIKNDTENKQNLGIQKDYDSWKSVSKMIRVSKKITNVIKSDTESGSHQSIEEETTMSGQIKEVFEYWRKVMKKKRTGFIDNIQKDQDTNPS